MGVRFELSCGRIVGISSFHCWETYQGVVIGVPNARINQMFIDSYERAGACVVAPKIYKRDEREEYLPHLTCRAILSSTGLNRKYGSSSLTVVWFADDCFEEPLVEFIAKSVREVSWEKATDDEW
jgi:hypothetical protein